MLLRSRGLNRAYGEVVTAFDLSENGVSVRQVVDVLGRFGVGAQAWRTTTASLDSFPLSMILHVDESHFIVLDSIGGGVFYVRDPASGREALDRKELEARWDGVVIIVPVQTPLP